MARKPLQPEDTHQPGKDHASSRSGTRPAGSGSDRDRTVLPGQQPSDAAPPEDEGPLESLGKAVSAPVREAGGSKAGGRGRAPR